MKKIIGVRFKKPGKIYFFDPQDLELNMGDKVIVETSMGEELGTVVVSKRELPDDKIEKNFKKSNKNCYKTRYEKYADV